MSKKILFYLVNWIWAFPQSFLGLFVFLYCKCKCNNTNILSNGIILTNWDSTAGLSLGMFVFVNPKADYDTIKHETGHTVQSLIFGWLWLILFGIPSLIWAGIHKPTSIKSYYWFYTEKLADYLGKVDRKY